MRQGKAARMLLLLPLLLLLLLGTGAWSGDASTTSASTTKSESSATTTITSKPNIVTSGNTATSTVKPTTSKTILSVASTLAIKSASSAPTKETQQTTLGSTRPIPIGSTSKGASIKPSSSPVTFKTTQETKATTAPRTPTVPTVIGPRDPSVPSSSGSPRTVAATPSPSTQSIGSPSPIVLTASSRPDAPTSHRQSTTPGHGGSAVSLESSTSAKEKSTLAPRVPIATTATMPGHTPPKGAVPTTVTIPEGKKDTATTQTPSRVTPPTPDLRHETAGTTRATTISPEHHVPSPDSGINGTSFQAESKIVCEDTVPSKYPGIVLTFNESRPCKNIESSSLKERLMYELCRDVKSSFNRSRDDCTVHLASVADDPKKLAIIRVSVTTHSKDDELAESLAVKKGELEKIGLSNLTYGGKPMDLDTEDRFGMPLIITIVCMAASLLLVAAIYGCCHQRISRRKDQQRLTEELQTMENGYHDNPTLEVMETSAEMQEKKVNLNGELADSWIVPMDSLTKDDLEEEEDTHL